MVAVLVVAFAGSPFAIPQQTNFLTTYKGVPYTDTRHRAGAQNIPGKVECAYYDLGGEGVAYHDRMQRI